MGCFLLTLVSSAHPCAVFVRMQYKQYYYPTGATTTKNGFGRFRHRLPMPYCFDAVLIITQLKLMIGDEKVFQANVRYTYWTGMGASYIKIEKNTNTAYVKKSFFTELIIVFNLTFKDKYKGLW